MPVNIRPLRWTDFEEQVRVYYDLYQERDEGIRHGIPLFHQRPTEADEVSWFADLFRRSLTGETIVRVAEAEGRAVGWCTIGPAGPRRESETGHVGVLGIMVARPFRGRGVGERLMRASLEAARGSFEQVRLGVLADNTRALRLYERLGFQVCGRIPRSVKRGDSYEDEVLMILELPTPEPPRTKG